MKTLRIIAPITFLIALALWGLFGFLVWSLYAERAEYAKAQTAAGAAELRGESASRLRASVRDTENERAAIENLSKMSILRAVEIIEATGRQAGATEVSIGEATPLPPAKDMPAGLTAVVIVVNASGSFASLMREVSLYETLAMPSSLEQFELEKTGGSWSSTARIRVLLSLETP